MKRIIAILLVTLMLLASCAPSSGNETTAIDDSTAEPLNTEPAATEPDETKDLQTDAPETEAPVKVQRDDFSIEVKEDTYVVNKDGKGDQSNNSFADDKMIDVKSSGNTLTRYGYVKFDISALADNSDFTCVDLDLTVSWRQKDPGNPEYARVEIYGCDTDWQGSQLTFNTRPAEFELITALDEVTNETVTISFPVTAYIKKALKNGNTEVAFFIKEATEISPLRIQFHSKESGNKAPMLSVYHGTKVDDNTYSESVEVTLPEVSKNGLDSILGLHKVSVSRIDTVEDTYVEAGTSADINFGAAEHLDFKGTTGAINNYYRVSLIKFDISEIKDVDFKSAFLSLECNSMENTSIPTPVHVYGCFPYDWQESEVTFNTIPEREDFITTHVVYGMGNVRIDVTDYVKRFQKAGQQYISFYLQGDSETVRRLNFASKENKNGTPQIILGDVDGKINTQLQYTDVNPWEYAMENVSDWLVRWENIKKGGDTDVETIVKDSAEYSLSVGATRSPNGAKTNYTKYPTRALNTLKGYTANTAETAKYDVYGGLMDESMKQEATGFFYTKKIGDRWWTIDPLGYPFYRTAVVAIVTGSANQKAKVMAKYGTNEAWAEATTDRLRELGFNSTGGWSSTANLINTEQPLAQTSILYVLKKYCQAHDLDISESGSTDLLYGILPVFDPGFVESAYATVKTGVKGYETSPAFYGWMSDNELPASMGMLDTSLTLDTNDPRFGYTYATAWTFMYLKTGKKDVSLADVTEDLRKEYRAMVYDRYFKIVRQALDRYAPCHQFMGCRFVGGAFDDEYVMRVAGNWCDVISYNYYGVWEPNAELIANQQKWAGKPFIVTEWYAKGMDVWEKDNRMTNESGAGWTVKDQNDRGFFYQNYSLQLLECKGCVGFDWFQYTDNDPENLSADLSNRNANKGVVDNNGEEYTTLTKYMGEINNQKYNLIKFFDAK